MSSKVQQPFFLTKVTSKKYADALVNGEVYLQPIQNFWGIFSEEISVQNQFRGDNLECLNALFELTENFFELTTIPIEIKNLVRNLDINIADWQAIGLIDGALGSEKIYCLYSLMYDSTSNKINLPNSELLSFGDTSVIIKEPTEFLGKICLELFKSYGDRDKDYSNQPFWFRYDAIEYNIDEIQPKTAILDEFCKAKRYAWQNEFRFVVDLSPNMTVHSLPITDLGVTQGFPSPKKDKKIFEPIKLQIGDISDICEIVPTKNLLIETELEQLSNRLGIPKEIEFPVSLYKKKPKQTVFRTILMPKRIEAK